MAQCAELLDSEFERVFYRNDHSFSVAILNLYMILGGTNWGNLRNLSTTHNTYRHLGTPTSLYDADYGYDTGLLLFRGHFTATGAESTLTLLTPGSTVYGASAWLDATLLGSGAGADRAANHSDTFTLHSLAAGIAHVLHGRHQ